MPELNVMRAAFVRTIAQHCPSTMHFADSLWDRICTAQWTLEWQLPLWLGQSLGIDRAVSTQLVLGNVMGLGSLRLQDDLLDGEIEEPNREDAIVLSALLYQAAVDAYRRLIPERSAYWAQLDLRMAEWRAASRERGPRGRDGDAPSRLAALGAPLKLCVFAVCELAGRMDLLPTLERCLDEVLTAMVLYDHACDWRADLHAGRWNAFTAACTRGSAEPRDRDRTRADVYVAMMARGAVSRYFATIDQRYARAVALAEPLAIPALTEYLRRQMADIHGQSVRLEGRYSQLGERAAALMFAGSPAN